MRTPWNKGKIGIYSKEVLESNRQKHLGKKHSDESKEKIRIKLQQRILSEEHKRKIGIKTRERHLGKNFYELYGLIGSMEKRAKLGANNWARKMKGNFPSTTLEKKRFNTLGEKNPMFGIRGEQSHAWLGGKKFEPYTKEFNKYFKEAIRSRDNYCCVKCGMFRDDHKKLFANQNLDVHHINYDKKLTLNENCCTLCKRCNNEVNYNRKHWTKFFQSLMNERHGYQYDGNEIIVNLNEVEL